MQSKVLGVDPTLIHKFKHNFDEHEWYTYANTPPGYAIEAKKLNSLKDDETETKSSKKTPKEDNDFWK